MPELWFASRISHVAHMSLTCGSHRDSCVTYWTCYPRVLAGFRLDPLAAGFTRNIRLTRLTRRAQAGQGGRAGCTRGSSETPLGLLGGSSRSSGPRLNCQASQGEEILRRNERVVGFQHVLRLEMALRIPLIRHGDSQSRESSHFIRGCIGTPAGPAWPA
jgi:hypothetical protein